MRKGITIATKNSHLISVTPTLYYIDNSTPSLSNQDTMHGPSYIEKCAKPPLK